MKPKEYLSQAKWLDQMIDAKIMRQEQLRTMAEKITVDVSKEKVSGGIINARENVMVKLIDLSHEVNADIDSLIDLQKEVMVTIGQIEDERLRLILEMRYMYNNDWDTVSQTLDCERRWAMRLHKKALNEIDKILKTDHLKP